jgi:hypothetical protein
MAGKVNLRSEIRRVGLSVRVGGPTAPLRLLRNLLIPRSKTLEAVRCRLIPLDPPCWAAETGGVSRRSEAPPCRPVALLPCCRLLSPVGSNPSPGPGLQINAQRRPSERDPLAMHLQLHPQDAGYAVPTCRGQPSRKDQIDQFWEPFHFPFAAFRIRNVAKVNMKSEN